MTDDLDGDIFERFVRGDQDAFREEESLAASLGEVYRDYCQRVPRIWPSLTARVSGKGKQAQWAGFIAEIWCWGFAAAIAGFALILRIGIYLHRST